MKVKMKTIIRFLPKVVLLGFILLNAQSCVKLEEDISSILQIDNLKDEGSITASLAPIYRKYAQLVTDPHKEQMVCFAADDMTTWWAGNKAPFRVFDQFAFGNGENSDILWIDEAWNLYWEAIYYCNMLVEGLKTSTAPADIVKIADAEARFFRALSYFSLVKRYGNMPDIYDGMVPTGKEIRSTVFENYKRIEADLMIAELNLPDPAAVANTGRVSKAAAKTLFAEFYMSWAGWPIAPAPTSVCSSSMNRMMSPRVRISLRTFFSRSSKSPR
jgi:hypothetical protein